MTRTLMLPDDEPSYVLFATATGQHANQGEAVHERLMLAPDHVPDLGGEARVAVEAVERLSDRLPGGPLRRGVPRGTHLGRVLRRGLIPVAPVHAAVGGRSSGKPRVEKQMPYGPAEVVRPDRSRETVQLHLLAGDPGLVELDADGNPIFTKLSVSTRSGLSAHRSARFGSTATTPCRRPMVGQDHAPVGRDHR